MKYFDSLKDLETYIVPAYIAYSEFAQRNDLFVRKWKIQYHVQRARYLTLF